MAQRDDSGGRGRSGGPRKNVVHRLDPELVEWANAAGRTLLSDLKEPEIKKIVQQTLQAFTPFHTNFENPRRYLRRQIERRGELYRKLRGVEADAAPEDDSAPHILDVMRRKEAFYMLDGAQQRAICLVFFEGKTFEELAADLEVTVRYAERLVRGAVEQLRKWRPKE